MAKKPTLITSSTNYSNVNALNQNWQRIGEAFDNTLSRDGSTPNTMLADLDMNSNDVINAGTYYGQSINVEEAVIGGESLSASALAAAVESAEHSSEAALGYSLTAQGHAMSTAADRVQTGFDRTATALSAAQAALYEGAWLDTVAALVADTTLTYAASAGQVTVGQYVRTRAEGFAYEVAAASATDQHVTTAGGVKLYVLAGESGYNVKAFGAAGDGVTDDTSVFQKVIDVCKATPTAVAGVENGGIASLRVPQGFYRITSTLVVSAVTGFRITGAGNKATIIVFDATSDDLFEITQYIDVKISDMMIATGTISFSGGLPRVNLPVSRTNVAAKFNGNSGGTNIEWNNVSFWSFDKVFTTTSNIVNCDNHTHRHCRFYNNNYVWDNTNPQAVCWSFLQCKIFSTQVAVFNNAGGDLLVQGGDFINPGTFYKASLVNMGYDALFQGIRFENYQNIDPAATPKFLDLASGSYPNIVFDHCTARGGGILTGKESATLAGSFNIVMRDCAGFSGTWEVNAATAISGFLSGIVFERCVDSLVINQTLSGGVGNNPINIEYIQRRFANSTSNRKLYGRVNSLSGTQGIFGGIQADSFGYAASLNGSSFGREYTIFCPAPYQLAIAGFDIVWMNNTANTVVIDIYTDNTKATKIATVTTAAASGQRQVISIRPSDLLVRHTISSASAPLYFEATAALNAGTCAANVNVNLLQI